MIIRNVRLILPDRIEDNACVVVEGERIGRICGSPGPEGNDGFHILDGQGLYLSPGFVDIHTHGGGGSDFMDGTAEDFLTACRTHARFGTTCLVPTALAAAGEELRRFFQAFREASTRNTEGAYMPGVHLEGPYVSREYRGALDESRLKNPEPSDYRTIFDWSQGSILRWTAAPELPGFDGFSAFLRERGIRGSIGHSAAVFAQVLHAFENGFDTVTHLYSAMSGVTRKKGYRSAGVIESVYLLEGLRAELIADGCHLPPELLRLAYQIKGPDRLALVTDSMRGAGMPEGESVLGGRASGQKVIVENGVALLPDREAFAGSVCTADRLIRTMVRQAGVPLREAVKMATLTPATLIGEDGGRGSIEEGKYADMVLFDEDIRVRMTMRQGAVIFQSEG